MQITTNKGKAFDVLYIGAVYRNGNRMMIELGDDRPFAEIATDFDGLDTITREDSIRPGVKEVYEGFTRLVGMQLNASAGTIRLTLEKGDA